jgi:hypothetical protein
MTDAPETFWTFVPQSMSVKAGEGLSVTGWFVYGDIAFEAIEGGGSDPALKSHYLTPIDDPITILLPMWLVSAKHIGDVKMSDVVGILQDKIFGFPFKPIPKAPSDLPMHRIPPGRRKSIKDALGR